MFLHKAQIGQKWEELTFVAKEAALKQKMEKQKISLDEDESGPNDDMMSMLKKIYNEGDDEIKRTNSRNRRYLL